MMETMRIGYGVPVRVQLVDSAGFAYDMRRCRCLSAELRRGEDGDAVPVQDAIYDEYTNTVMVRLGAKRLPVPGIYSLKIGWTDRLGRAMTSGWFEAVEMEEGIPRRCIVVNVRAEAKEA